MILYIWNMSLVEIRPVKSKSDLREFIFLPSKIYHTRKNWVPPLYVDEWKFYDPKKIHHWLIVKLFNSWLIRRMFVSKNYGYHSASHNRLKNERTAQFFQLECIQDPQVSHALIEAVECWSKQKAANILIGPFGFSDKDPQGLQVEGFEYLPVIAT